MKIPFTYGKIATGNDYTNRVNETKKVVSNFNALTNTILISPRRWGKTSLVHSASIKAMEKNKKLKICFIDLYNVKSEHEFYQQLMQEVLKVTSSKTEEIFTICKQFLNQFIPRISFGSDGINDLNLQLEWSAVAKNPDEILDLAEKIAKNKKIKLVICIDEFQNISGFIKSIDFQNKLRSQWQRHQHVSYCLYGCKSHMLTEMFSSASMPFYKFGETLFLEKISEKEWITFLKKRFKETGKQLDNDNALQIAKAVENHPYYVQQLAQQSWLRSLKKCSSKIIYEAYDDLIRQMSLLFQLNTDELTIPQIGFLRALVEEANQLSSKEAILKYNLGTSANVARIKQALLQREIIDIRSNQIEFVDPLYKAWLKRYYFQTEGTGN